MPGQHIIDSLMSRLLNYAAISMVLLFCKCTAISYLPKEEYYYDDTDIVIVTDESTKTQNRIIDKIIDYVGPKKNQKSLGSRPEVWSYHIAGKPIEQTFIRYFIKNKLGTPPVFLSEVHPKRIAAVMEGQTAVHYHVRHTVDYANSRNIVTGFLLLSEI